jgi:hypothetical protein
VRIDSLAEGDRQGGAMATFTMSDELEGAEFVDAACAALGSSGLTCPAS